MVQRLGSEHEAVPHRAFWRWAATGAALVLTSAAACATGVDVSQAELAEICADSNDHCDSSPSGDGGASGTGAVGISGSSGSGTSGNSGNSGSQNNTGGSSSGVSGSSGNNSGSSGAGGSSGSTSTPLQPLAKGMCMATSSVVIVYTDDSKGGNNQAQMQLHVDNKGAAFDLTNLTIRYWFTDDGAGVFTSNVDYASQGGGQDLTSSVKVTFGVESGSNFASIGFSSGGSVGPEGVDQIKLRLHTGDYKMIDQSNDFSFLGSAAAVDNANITPYVNGTQVGGCVPLAP